MRSKFPYIIAIATCLLALGFLTETSRSTTSWLKDGKVQSPFEFYATKYLVFADQDGIEYVDSNALRKWKEFFGLKSNQLIKRNTKLSLVLKPNCELSDLDTDSKKKNWILGEVPSLFKKLRFKPSVVITMTEDTQSQHLERWAEQNSCVIGLSNRRLLKTTGIDSDPDIGKQTHWQSLQLRRNYKQLKVVEDSLTKKVVIAVIDTGIDLSHRDLSQNLWVNTKEWAGKSGVDDDGNKYIDDIFGFDFANQVGDPSHKHSFDHGTHVAGLAAAVGENGEGGRGLMATNVEIMALNVTGNYKGAMSEEIEEAIYYAVHMGARVINISMGGPGRVDALAHAISYAVNQGVVVVSSAGNNGKDLGKSFESPVSYASSIPGFISVGAFEVSRGDLCEKTNYSKRFVEIAAPGCDARNPKMGLYSTSLGSTYGYRKGTSMAAPIVSGAVALYISWLYTNSFESRVSAVDIEKVFTTHMAKNSNLKKLIKDGNFFSLQQLLKMMPVKK